jgi:3-hydroxyacyl-CoA dehydrogenase/enoyl-CoA hydratase/3-hydroxybutyryl-CoA epimerase
MFDSSKNNKQNLKLVIDDNNIAWLYIDLAGRSINLLSQIMINDIDALIKHLLINPPRGLVIVSDKKDSFIFGADINEFYDLDSEQSARDFMQNGHRLMNRLDSLPCPTVSMVHGYCLGGGTELSLACDYIIASDHPKTKIGLPEIRLGIFPGYGGTFRSIERCGPLAAINLMLTGRSISAHAARKIRLIDNVVPHRQLKTAAEHYVLNAPERKKLPLTARLAGLPMVRPFIAAQMRKQLARKVRSEHYPAPYALIDLWQSHADNKTRMLEQEINNVAKLAGSQTARNLLHVFSLQEKLKNTAKQDNFNIAHIHVIGGGIMGGDIAAWCAIQGYSVSVQDQEPALLAQTIKRAQCSFKKKFKNDRRAIRDANDRLIADHRGNGLSRADIVIEAIFEDAETKRNLYQSIEPLLKQDTVLATNTSSIKLEELASSLVNPGRLVGLHFFNPVALMPLVEVVRGNNTDNAVVRKALAFGKSIGKFPLEVKSSPGFLVNRILMPYILEAVTMIGEGIHPEVIDRAATDYGMPMGPVELADTIGLDICKSVAGILSDALVIPLPDFLSELDDSKLGKKSGEGFYKYKNNKPVKNKKASYSNIQEVQDRLILPLLNEVVACLREGIVTNAELVDAGVIFGTGFAPFTGGPITYIKSIGIEQLTGKLDALKNKYGDRFEKDPGWNDL